MSDQDLELRFLAEEMKALEDEKERLEELAKDNNAKLDELRLRRIPEKMAAMGIKTINFTGLGRVQLASDIYASTKAEKKLDAYQWLRDIGQDGMIAETVNASTLKALFRRMLKEGVPIPEEIFNVTPFTRASIVKG